MFVVFSLKNLADNIGNHLFPSYFFFFFWNSRQWRTWMMNSLIAEKHKTNCKDWKNRCIFIAWCEDPSSWSKSWYAKSLPLASVFITNFERAIGRNKIQKFNEKLFAKTQRKRWCIGNFQPLLIIFDKKSRWYK